MLNIRLFFLAIIVSATSLAMEEAKLFESFHEGSIAEIKDPKIVLTLKGEELKTYLNQLKSCNLRYERYFRRAAKLMSALKEEDQKIYGEFRDNIIGQLENCGNELLEMAYSLKLLLDNTEMKPLIIDLIVASTECGNKQAMAELAVLDKERIDMLEYTEFLHSEDSKLKTVFSE